MCNKWIPVGERLPAQAGPLNPLSDNVLAYDPDGGVFVAYYTWTRAVWVVIESGKLPIKPTHWMPLPEAPYTPVIVATNQDGNDV